MNLVGKELLELANQLDKTVLESGNSIDDMRIAMEEAINQGFRMPAWAGDVGIVAIKATMFAIALSDMYKLRCIAAGHPNADKEELITYRVVEKLKADDA